MYSEFITKNFEKNGKKVSVDTGLKAFMCPNCYGIRYKDIIVYQTHLPEENTLEDISIDVGCPNCNEINSYSYYKDALDANIASIVSEFNKMGFHTLYSCEGHGDSIAYIQFSGSKTYNILWCYKDLLPERWYMERKETSKFNVKNDESNYKLTIYFDEDLYYDKENDLKDLQCFVNKLKVEIFKNNIKI